MMTPSCWSSFHSHIFPFFTMEPNFLRVWPFWSKQVEEGREKVKVLDLIPIRNADGFTRNWEPFWSLYSSEDLPDGRVRRKFLFNIFWWTSPAAQPADALETNNDQKPRKRQQ